MHGDVRGEVVPDRRQRISLARLGLRVQASRYKAIEHSDGSITLVPMRSVPLRAPAGPGVCMDPNCYDDSDHAAH